MKRRLFLGILTLAILLSSFFVTPRINSSQSSIDLGLNYLMKSQNPDGSWGKQLDLQGSAFAVVALEKAGQICTGDKAHLNKQGITAAYDLALRLLGDPQNNTAQSLLNLQNPEGEWGDPYTTAIALMGIAKLGTANPEAVTYLKTLQNADGSWGINGTDEMTAIVLYAIELAGDRGSELQKGINWLKEHQTPKGGWSNISATAWAVLALNRFGGYDNEVKKAITFLVASKLSDGGWGLGKEPVSAVYPSAMALWALASADPQNAVISDGIAYLQSARHNEAGWYNQELAIPTTLEVAEVKYKLGKLDGLDQAGLWVEKVNAHNTASMAARLSYLVKYGQASPETKIKLQTDLLAMVNADGGWGSWLGYESDPYDTSMALRALWDSGYANPPVYQKAVTWLKSRQLEDGSFNMRAKEIGQVYLTAHLALTLEKLKPLADVQLVLDPAVCWIVTQRKADGSFGRGVLDTALAMVAAAPGLNVADLNGTLAYLESKQRADGSWESDDRTTATVLAALNILRPNLTIADGGITLSPQDICRNDQVQINIEVKNMGYGDAGNVKVKLYQGKPEDGVLIGSGNIGLIQAKQTGSVVLTWKATEVGEQELTAIVDPGNDLSESDEGDNEAVKQVTVYSSVDLALSNTDVSITPEDPGPTETLTIKSVVHNLGKRDSGAFKVAFYNGDPQQGGKLLGSVDCPNVPGQGVVEVVYSQKLPEGTYQIFSVVDCENQIPEDLENNNIAFVGLTVEKRVDLAISYNNISFSNTEPNESDKVKIYATITNRREEPVKNVPVSFYLGNPDTDGKLLDTIILSEVPGNSTHLAGYILDTSGITGRQLIYVVIDHDNLINEVDKTNNRALQILYINARPELSGSISAGTMTEGVPYTFTISITNLGGSSAKNFHVRVFLGDPASGRKLCDDITISEVGAGGTGSINLAMDTLNLAGTQKITVQIDPENIISEPNESNNVIEKSITVNPAPELSVEEFTNDPTPIFEGDPVKLNATLKNLTSQRVTGVVVRLYNLDNNEWVTLSQQTVTVEANSQSKLSFQWNSDYHLGNNQFKITVDPDGNIYERNKTNNTITQTFEVKEAQLPDLTVESSGILIVPAMVAKNDSCVLKAEIKNLRTFAAENVSVRFYDGDPAGGGTVIGEQIVNVAGRATVTVETTWLPQTKVYREIYVCVDPANTIAEYNENNNTARKQIVLRANKDYQVKNLKANVNYHDVSLSWDQVDQSDLSGYLVYRDDTVINNVSSATHGTVKASSQYSTSYSAAKAVDGDVNTFWHSTYTTSHWFEEELPEYRFIKEVQVQWYEGYKPANLSIEIWNGDKFVSVDYVENAQSSTVSIYRLGNYGYLAKRYRLVINSAPTNTYVIIREIKINSYDLNTSCTYNDMGLLSGNYQYTITSINQQGEESLPSTPAEASVLPPSKPAGFTAQVDGPNVKLSWEQSTTGDLRGYYLLRNGQILGENESVTGTASAFASANSSYGPEKAFDGSTSSFWYYTSANSNGWWQLNLPQKRYLSSIKVNWVYRPMDYEVLVWQNNAWQKVAEVHSNQLDVNEIKLNKVLKSDKIRINILKPYLSGTTCYYGIYEVNVQAVKNLAGITYDDIGLTAGKYLYNLTAENSLMCESDPAQQEIEVKPPMTPTDVTADVDGKNVTLNWKHQRETDFAGYYILRNDQVLVTNQAPGDIGVNGKASASSVYSTSSAYQPGNALDRNAGTYWYSAPNVYPLSFTVQLPQVKVISGIKITWYSMDYSAKDLLIQYRMNGTWYTIQRLSGASTVEGTYMFPNAVKTDAIRIYCTSGTSSYLIMREFYIYENPPLVETTYIDSGLPDGKYSYSIIAADKVGNWSSPSAPVSATVGTLAAPENLVASVSDSNISLDWQVQNIDDLSGFYIYRDNLLVNAPKNVTGGCAIQVSSNPTSVKNIWDNNNNTYWYPSYNAYPASVELTSPSLIELCKVNIQWYSTPPKAFRVLAWVNDAWIPVCEEKANTQSFNETLLENFIKTNKVRLEILSGPSYIYLAEFRVYDANLVKTTHYVDSVIENGNYTYYVRAAKERNLSAASNQVTVEVKEETPPARPSGLTISETSGALLIHWNVNGEKDLAGYNLYLGDSTQPVNSSLIKANQYSYAIQIGVREFNFRLVAVDINGNSSESSSISYAMARPLPPTNLKSTVDKRTVTLSWNGSQSLNVSGYKVYRNNNLVNKLNRAVPISIQASSYYFNNANYQPSYASDQNTNTIWRPGYMDYSPYVELQLNGVQAISVIEIKWLNNEKPASYHVDAWYRGSWQRLTSSQETSDPIVLLPQVVTTDRLRLVIDDRGSGLISLSEFNGYTVQLLSSPNVNQDLVPGSYAFEVSAVNITGLESDRSTASTAEITTRDVAILAGDIAYTPFNPSVFDNITISVNVENTGTIEVTDIPVALYIGDPKADGRLIAKLTVSSIKPGEKSLVQYIWDPTGYNGALKLYAVADPDNMIPEYDETNNTLSRNITINETAVLQTKVITVDSSDFPNIQFGIQVNDALEDGVAGLRKENFTIKENNIVQEITNLECKVGDQSELAKVDLVFAIDTSGSMSDEWSVLPGILKELSDTLTKVGIDFQYKIYALVYPQTSQDIKIDVLKQGVYQGKVVDLTTMGIQGEECWSPATAWVANYYTWREGAFRVVIPISDENCYGGEPETQEDLHSISEAIGECTKNNVEVYPFYGFSDTSDSVKSEMRTLAQGTGGEMFFFQDASQVVTYLSRVLSTKKVHYTITYRSTNPTKDGTLRNITVDTLYRHATGSCQGQYRAPQDTLSDLAVASLSCELINAEQTKIKTVIQNNGGVPAENIEVDFYIGDPQSGGICFASESIANIAPNGISTIEVPWKTVAGTYRIYIAADPKNKIAELNESNNTASTEIYIPGVQKPDLLVLENEVTLSSPNPYCGQRVEIKARIHNIGAPCGTVEIGFFLGSPQSGGKLIRTSKLASLQYLEYQDVTVPWYTDITTGDANIYVIADPLNQIDEYNETNNQVIKTARISERAISGSISTDKPGYQPNENAILYLQIANHQQSSWSGSAKIVIKDIQNRFIKELATYNIAELLGDTGNSPGEWRQEHIWCVGKLSPGRYVAYLQVIENGDPITEYATDFEIYAVHEVDGTLYTNKTVYAPNDKANITVNYSNVSPNTSLNNLTLNARVTDALNQVIWTEQLSGLSLALGQQDQKVWEWPISNDAIGNYQVYVEITNGLKTLWSGTKLVQVDPKTILTGTLAVQPQKGRNGQLLSLDYTVFNRGNVNVEDLMVKIRIVDPVTEAVEKEIAGYQGSLGVNETKVEKIIQPIQLKDAQYIVLLVAESSGISYPLSHGTLLVDSTPPGTLMEITKLRLQKNGVQFGVLDSKMSFTAVDNLSGVAETDYNLGNEWLIYVDPVSFLAEGKYTIKYRSCDQLGNLEQDKEGSVIIDQTPPVIQLGNISEGQEVKPEFSLTLTASDNVALDYYELYIDGKLYAKYTDVCASPTIKLEPGPHVIQGRAVDLAEYETWSPVVNITVINPDKTPPVTVADYPADWINTAANVALTAVDTESGVQVTYYRIDQGGWRNGSTFEVSGEGIHQIDFYSVDNVGNAETVQSIKVKIDLSKPKTVPEYPEEWVNTQATINLKAEDQLSGIRVTRYRVNGGEWCDGGHLAISEKGTHRVEFYSIDKAGNTEDIRSLTVRIDCTPPVTKAQYPTGWVKTDAQVILTATDQESGVQETLYQIDGGEWQKGSNFSIGVTGTHPIEFYSADRAGNVEETQSITVKVDKIAPVTVADYPAYWVGTSVNVKFTANDANSGVKETQYRVDGQEWVSGNSLTVDRSGIHVVEFNSTDQADNQEATKKITVKIDKTAPITTAQYPQNWINVDATVILTAVDSESGVKETRYRVDNGTWNIGSKFTITNPGTHTVEFFSIDKVGNTETAQKIVVKIDKKAPKTNLALVGDQWSNGAYKSKVTITLSASDEPGGSGVARVYYRIGSTGTYTLYTKPFILNKAGVTQVYVYAEDVAGNKETAQCVGVKIIAIFSADYSLLCKKLEIHGNLNVDRVFVDGKVDIYGQCHLNYLGTVASSILKTGPSTIDSLNLNQPYIPIPTPDWTGLSKVTTLRKETQIPQNTTLSNVRFENSLMIAGTTKLSGIIVVKGDLEINGNVTMNNAGIFCTGKVTFNGNVNGTCLIYAGSEYIAHGNPQINGAIIVNGPVTASGTVGNKDIDLQQYLRWLMAAESIQ